MDWRYYLTTQLINYINRGASEGYERLDQFMMAYGENFIHEVDEIIDQENAAAIQLELEQLETLIQLDAKIQTEDPNVQRILQTIDHLIREQSQEVDYSNDDAE